MSGKFISGLAAVSLIFFPIISTAEPNDLFAAIEEGRIKRDTGAAEIRAKSATATELSTADEEKLIDDKLFPNITAKWPGGKAPVCWENPTDDNKKGRAWVRDAILNSWEKHTPFQFLNWRACKENSVGIRILIEDRGPHVKVLGRKLDGIKNGMVLNFTFNTWGIGCGEEFAREGCIRAVAVHEFGHAMGFSHEQNRPDAPGECATLAQGTDGNDTTLTPYDPYSVMNYCAPQWNAGGVLSALDIKGANKFYSEAD